MRDIGVLWVAVGTYTPLVIVDPAGLVATLPYTCILWQLSLDKELIDFGSYVVGETTSRIITLSNVGGLGTRFKFLLDSELFDIDESQPVKNIVSSVPTADQQP